MLPADKLDSRHRNLGHCEEAGQTQGDMISCEKSAAGDQKASQLCGITLIAVLQKGLQFFFSGKPCRHLLKGAASALAADSLNGDVLLAVLLHVSLQRICQCNLHRNPPCVCVIRFAGRDSACDLQGVSFSVNGFSKRHFNALFRYRKAIFLLSELLSVLLIVVLYHYKL